MSHQRITAIEKTITQKFEHMRTAASEYWDLRDQITKQKYSVGFHNFAYGQDRVYSGAEEAWEDFGSKMPDLRMKLDTLKVQFGSVDAAFKQMKQNLLVDTDAIVNSAFAILKEGTNAKSTADITSEGRRLYGYKVEPDEECDEPFVLVKDLIWYGRNQVNHYMDEPRQAVRKLKDFQIIFAKNLTEAWHPIYAEDMNTYFVPEARTSMSDEIIRILGWKEFSDFEQDLLEYLGDG